MQQYLYRIGITDVEIGRSKPDLALLEQLLKAHLMSVPFENLDIIRRQPVSLDPKDLYAKIVTRNRGGFCYELNGLFSELLRELGYDVELLSGSVRRKDGSYGNPGEHLTLMVNLDQPYLVEVGFALSFPRVMTIDGADHRHPKGTYRVGKLEEYQGSEDHVVERKNGDEWIPEFRFDRTPHPLEYFKSMCVFMENSPSFNAKAFCIIGTPDGSISLKEQELVIRKGESETRSVVGSLDEFWALMRTTCEPFKQIAESIAQGTGTSLLSARTANQIENP